MIGNRYKQNSDDFVTIITKYKRKNIEYVVYCYIDKYNFERVGVNTLEDFNRLFTYYSCNDETINIIGD